MLSRRNVRIKVMQTLYALSRDEKLEYATAIKQYKAYVLLSFELYLFNILILIKVSEYANEDSERRKAKLLPTEEDKHFTAILAENEILQFLSNNEGLNKHFNARKLSEKLDLDIVRKLYFTFAKRKNI